MIFEIETPAVSEVALQAPPAGMLLYFTHQGGLLASRPWLQWPPTLQWHCVIYFFKGTGNQMQGLALARHALCPWTYIPSLTVCILIPMPIQKLLVSFLFSTTGRKRHNYINDQSRPCWLHVGSPLQGRTWWLRNGQPEGNSACSAMALQGMTWYPDRKRNP